MVQLYWHFLRSIFDFISLPSVLSESAILVFALSAICFADLYFTKEQSTRTVLSDDEYAPFVLLKSTIPAVCSFSDWFRRIVLLEVYSNCFHAQRVCSKPHSTVSIIYRKALSTMKLLIKFRWIYLVSPSFPIVASGNFLTDK